MKPLHALILVLSLIAFAHTMSFADEREYQSEECPGCLTPSEWVAQDAEYADFTDSDVGCTDDCLDSQDFKEQ